MRVDLFLFGLPHFGDEVAGDEASLALERTPFGGNWDNDYGS